MWFKSVDEYVDIAFDRTKEKILAKASALAKYKKKEERRRKNGNKKRDRR